MRLMSLVAIARSITRPAPAQPGSARLLPQATVIVGYQSATGVGLPPLLTQSVDRQGARIGPSAWTALVQ